MDLKDISNYAIGLLGLILTVYYYHKSKEGKEPTYFYLNFQDIKKLNEENSKIKVIYENKDVEQVFTSYIWLWNRGRRPINKSDIPPQSPVRIIIRHKSNDVRVLDWKIIKTSRQAINFHVGIVDKTTLEINFDFLDHNDGAVLEIQHTGDDKTEIELDGVILGCPEGIKKVSSKFEFNIFSKKVFVGKYSSQNRKFSKPSNLEFYLGLLFLNQCTLLVLVYFDIGAVAAKETIWFTPSYIIMWFLTSVELILLVNRFLKKYPFPSKLYLEE